MKHLVKRFPVPATYAAIVGVVASIEAATRGYFWFSWFAGFPGWPLAYIVEVVLIIAGIDITVDAPGWQTAISLLLVGASLVIAAFAAAIGLQVAFESIWPIGLRGQHQPELIGTYRLGHRGPVRNSRGEGESRAIHSPRGEG